jgi:uncharacterized protein with HEPN domain
LAHAEEASQMLAGKTAASVDRVTELALIHLVQIVGEAAARVPIEVQRSLATIPFRPAIGLRNIIVHGYGKVRIEEIVRIISHDFPPMIAALKDRLREGDQT